jgi:D-proline reductase (dithiol) PrdB
VGLIQRAVEAAGIATISITFSKEIARKVRPPRTVYTHMPLGHPLGLPDQRFRQIQILRLLLKYLKDIQIPGTIIDTDLTQGDDPVITCSLCGV